MVVPQHYSHMFFFLMIRRPPRSTLDRSSAASDVYKRQERYGDKVAIAMIGPAGEMEMLAAGILNLDKDKIPVSYTHLRAHETVLDLVCRLLLEKKKNTISKYRITHAINKQEHRHIASQTRKNSTEEDHS